MHPEPEGRLSPEETRRSPSVSLILAAIVITVVIAVMYFSGGQSEPPTIEEPAPASIPEPVIPPAPDIPPPATAPEPVPEEPPVEPEVTLETSDQDLRKTLSTVGNSPLITRGLLANDLVQRSAGMIDSFNRGLVPRKILPTAPPKEKFSTIKIDGKTYMDPASYKRYDSYAQAIASLDIELLVSTFHRYRALLEQVYAQLGYVAADLDNALIRSLDYILATPESTEQLSVRRKEAVYQYVDPELEQLTPLQKQLLRMGPENTAIIKQQAAALRKGLLDVSG
jgi:hypothetical protein